MLLLPLDGDGPLHRQLYRSLRGAILAGRLGAGARLPSTRSLARELGLARNTVLLACEQLVAEGIPVNVTLIFSVERYEAVMNAYLAGLEKLAAQGRPLDRAASVASFFISRIDTAVDKELKKLIGGGRRELTGLLGQAVVGRLLIAKVQRSGFRPQTLYLFTTLTDALAYPPQKLLELYGWRWRVELNLRSLKSSMDMDQSEAKSPEMVKKEFYAGLMAYNLVRGLMASAAAQRGCQPHELSFTKVHGLLVSVLTELFMIGMSRRACLCRLEWLLQETSAAKLPRRSTPRPSEPRAQYHQPQVFPKIKGSREEARAALKKANHKC